MRNKPIVLIAAAAFLLAACEGAGQKETAGTLIGAAAGGLLGAQFGSGAGKIAAATVGTLAGGFIGSSIGKSLDRADQQAMVQAQQQAHAAPVGQQINWNNPDSGNSGTITPLRDGTSSGGAYCREYQTTVTVGGKTEDAFGTACQQPDGSWKIVS